MFLFIIGMYSLSMFCINLQMEWSICFQFNVFNVVGGICKHPLGLLKATFT